MARHTEAVLRRLHQAADHGSLRIQIATSRSNKRGSPYGGVLEKASSALRDTNCPIWPLMPIRISLAERIVPNILIKIQALGIIQLGVGHSLGLLRPVCADPPADIAGVVSRAEVVQPRLGIRLFPCRYKETVENTLRLQHFGDRHRRRPSL